MLIVLGFVLLILGLLHNFLGYKLYKFWLGVCGFFVGGVIGGVIGYLITRNAATVIFVIVLGILGAVLNVVLWRVGIFIQCFTYGFLILFIPIMLSQLPKDVSSGVEMGLKLLTTGSTGINPYTAIAVGLVGGIVLGILGVILARPIIIITSSLVGGVMCGGGIGLMIGQPNPTVIILVGLVAATFGMLVQFKTTGKKKAVSNGAATGVVQGQGAYAPQMNGAAPAAQVSQVSGAAPIPQVSQVSGAVPAAQEAKGASVAEKVGNVTSNVTVAGAQVIGKLRQETQNGLQKVAAYQQAEEEKAKAKSGTLAMRELLDQMEAFIYGNRFMAWCMPFTKILMCVVLILFGVSGIIGGGGLAGLLGGFSRALPLVLILCLLCTIKREYLVCVVGLAVVTMSSFAGWLIYVLLYTRYNVTWWSCGTFSTLCVCGLLIYVECVLYAREKAAPAAVFCPNCGRPVEHGILFCSECGTKVEQIQR